MTTTNTDDLTATVHSALTALDPVRKAEFLLDTALALINAGKYGDDVERYLDVYLKTPNLPKPSIAKALLARANARKACGDRLLTQAHQDFQAVLRLDPSNRDVQNHIRRRTQIRFSHDPASHRAPPEVWSRIANYIPRYHLRTWLFLSTFHRSIALHHIFHTIDLYFGEDQPENVNRSLDIFDRVKQDKSFANLVRCLRVHWAYEEGELLDLMVRVFRTALPEFSALREFEWIGYPELRVDMVQSLLASHPKLTSLGSIGFHFDACGISAFKSLRKLTLRAEDDDGYADWSEITTVLNNNVGALRHLTLGAYLHRQHSWDATFLSPAIHNLTHLDLVDTRISHTVLSRIAHAAGGVGGRLESLTLHGILEDPGKAAVVFGSDEIINGEHTFLPRLKSFRFLLVGQPQVVTPPPPSHPPQPSSQLPYTYHPYPQIPQQQPPHPQDHYDPTILHLYQTITHFLRGRTALRRLDLGSCPWDLVSPVLPGLKGLRVLGVRIGCLVKGCSTGITASVGGGIGGGGISSGVECTSELDVLVKNLPSQIGTLRVEVGVSELPLHVYANLFQKFPSLSFLHLQLHTAQLVQHPPPGVQVGGVQQYHHQGYNAQPHFYPYQQGLQGHAGPSTPQQYTHNNNNLQQPQPTRAQPSYHPFPPHPTHATAAGVSPGTPKRRNNGPNTAGKRDGGGGGGGGGGDHEGEGDDSNVNTMNANNTGEGVNSTSGSGGGGGGSSSQAQGGTSSAHHHHHHQAPGASSASATGGRQPSMGPPPPPQSGQQYGHGHGHGQQFPVANFPQHRPPEQLHHHPFHHGPAHSPHLPLTPPQQQHPPLQPLDTLESAKHVAGAVPSLDFVGWNGELYVIVRNNASSNNNNIAAVKANTNPGGGDDSVVIKVDDTSVGGEGNVGIGPSRASAGPADPAGSTAPTPTPSNSTTAAASTNASVVPDTPNSNATAGGGPSRNTTPSTPHPLVAHPMPTQTTPSSTTTPITAPAVELKELPSRRRLDCGNGVDLGSEDAAWLERKDVPMDYDMPVTGVDGAAV